MSHRYQLFYYIKNNQVILALLLIVLAWFVSITHSILVSFFLSYIVTSALVPYVRSLKSHRAPTLLAVIIPYFIALIIIVILLTTIFNSFIPQLEKLIVHLPAIIAQTAKNLNIPIDGHTLQGYVTGQAGAVGQNAFDVTTRVFGGVFSLITVLIVSFYMLLYHDAFHDWIVSLFGKKYNKEVYELLNQIEDRLGAWARGQLLLSACIGISIFLALTVLGVPYALPLGLLAGLLELIPTLGPTLAAIPSILVALTVSPSTAIYTVILYVVIQFLESHILVPNIMQKAVGLNPVLVILAIGIGATLLGIPGALLAVPFISFLTVLIRGIHAIDDSNNA